MSQYKCVFIYVFLKLEWQSEGKRNMVVLYVSRNTISVLDVFFCLQELYLA